MKLENYEMSNANELPGRKGGLGLMAGTCMSLWLVQKAIECRIN